MNSRNGFDKFLFVVLMLMIPVAGSVKAQEINGNEFAHVTWTYVYNDEPVSASYIMELYKNGVEFHCGEVINGNSFKCFDTVEESVEFVIDQLPNNRGAQSLSSGHWTYYIHTGWNTVSHVLNNGQSNNNHAGIWSALTTGTANVTTIYSSTNQGGFSYTYGNSQWALATIPFGGGGGRSSKVD